jgi:hypothetical protein
MRSCKVACIEQRHGIGKTIKGASKHHVGGGSRLGFTGKPVSVDCGVNQATLSAKWVLIDSNDLPVTLSLCVCERKRGKEDERVNFCMITWLSHLFCSRAFDSSGKLLKSFDISKGCDKKI